MKPRLIGWRSSVRVIIASWCHLCETQPGRRKSGVSLGPGIVRAQSQWAVGDLACAIMGNPAPVPPVLSGFPTLAQVGHVITCDIVHDRRYVVVLYFEDLVWPCFLCWRGYLFHLAVERPGLWGRLVGILLRPTCCY